MRIQVPLSNLGERRWRYLPPRPSTANIPRKKITDLHRHPNNYRRMRYSVHPTPPSSPCNSSIPLYRRGCRTTCHHTSTWAVTSLVLGYGASLGGTICYINNPSLRLFSHTCLHISRTHLHTTSVDDQTRLQKKHKQQTNTTTMVEPLAPPAAWI